MACQASVGSVAVQVAAHATGPLPIARGEPDPDGPVLHHAGCPVAIVPARHPRSGQR